MHYVLQETQKIVGKMDYLVDRRRHFNICETSMQRRDFL